jgi:hypothetical protein
MNLSSYYMHHLQSTNTKTGYVLIRNCTRVILEYNRYYSSNKVFVALLSTVLEYLAKMRGLNYVLASRIAFELRKTVLL